MKSVILTLLVLCLLHSSLCTLDFDIYCNKTKNHLFCNDRNFTCPKNKPPKVSMPTPDDKFEIVETFNEFRQLLTKGNVLTDGRNIFIYKYLFMREMRYDDFLESMAELACKTCSVTSLPEMDRQLFSHLPGQMVGSPNVSKEIRDTIDVDNKVDWKTISWTKAIENLFTVDMVHYYMLPETDQFGRLHSHNFVEWAGKQHNYKEKDIDKVYGALNLYKDDNYLVGCAKSTYEDDGKPVYLFICFTGPSNVYIPISDNPQPSKETNLRLFSGDSNVECHPPKYYLGLCSSEDYPGVLELELIATNSTDSTEKPSRGTLQSFDAKILYLSLLSLLSF